MKAYRELERDRLAAARLRTGTFVERSLGRRGAAAQPKLQRELARWLNAARAAALDVEDVEALLRAAVRDHLWRRR
jgi:GntR family transcriptional regulator